MAPKRGAEPTTTTPTRRRFSASDIVLSPPARYMAGNGAQNQPVSVAIFKWCDNGKSLFPSGEEHTPVYQLQLCHDTRPSVTFGFLAAFRAFLPTWTEDVRSLEDLEQKHLIRVVMAPGGQERDPDGVGVKATDCLSWPYTETAHHHHLRKAFPCISERRTRAPSQEVASPPSPP